MLNRVYQSILDQLSTECHRVYGDRLITLGVFGSVGRETPHPSSDIDLILVVEDLPNGRTARIEEFTNVEDTLSDVLREADKTGYHTCLSPVIKTPSEVRKGSLLFLDMLHDLKVLYDRADFFKSYLEEFKDRLTRLKAKRIKRGNFWYWDLKPDYKAGEIIHL